ncbi:MAG: PIN domain-containing protein [Candidatus Dormibacteraeota bacterium]|uniref:Ribonuclease VapC n=1 Tax=Candidatus Dormiibacter inghamiae TaxID=3127013 RepID=A0A934KKL3_9BACT|nr:PIN domain-containing protein [Candidatus Dormibacteraeota bacterium]MBJ7606904.1 PIN domain-containing protein [Candidatus Dormibacteraeota bacterium]
MTLIVDAGALFAQANAADPDHEAVTNCLKAETGPLVTSELAAAEADYLILDRLGVDVELQFLTDLAEGTFTLECLTQTDLSVARDVVGRHRSLRLGLADASLVVLARRHHTRRILTFDHRAPFRTVAPLQGGRFTILPSDA